MEHILISIEEIGHTWTYMALIVVCSMILLLLLSGILNTLFLDNEKLDNFMINILASIIVVICIYIIGMVIGILVYGIIIGINGLL